MKHMKVEYLLIHNPAGNSGFAQWLVLFFKPEITQKEIYISLKQSGKLSPLREAAERYEKEENFRNKKNTTCIHNHYCYWTPYS